MIPRVGRQGMSFKGAAQYYLHDKDAQTAERVAHTETRNLPTQDPHLGWRVMAGTAMDADRLKREAGVDRRGAKLKRPVFHLSLSWHPDEDPDHAHMSATMDRALAALGLQRNQAVYVVHNDEPHPHIHAFVNLVDAENGRSNSVKYSKKRLSQWAQEYEREHGIYCEQRIANNNKRSRKRQFDTAAQKPDPKAQEAARKEDLKAELTRRYGAADSGRAFHAAVRELGYEIVQGKRILIVGLDGKEHSLARLLEGVNAPELRKTLKDVPLRSLEEWHQERSGEDGRDESGPSQKPAPAPSLKAATPFRKREREEELHDRDAQERRQDERTIDAAIEHQTEEVRTGLLNRLQDAQHDRLGSFYEEIVQERYRLDATLERQYGAHGRLLRQSIERREQQLAEASGVKRWYLTTFTRLTQDIENEQRTLAGIEQRKGEARDALEIRIADQRAGIEMSIEDQRARLQQRSLTPREVDLHARSMESQQRAADVANAPAADPSAVVQDQSEFERQRAAYLSSVTSASTTEGGSDAGEDVRLQQTRQQQLEQQAILQNTTNAQTNSPSTWDKAAQVPGTYSAEKAAYLRDVQAAREREIAPQHVPEHELG